MVKIRGGGTALPSVPLHFDWTTGWTGMLDEKWSTTEKRGVRRKPANWWTIKNHHISQQDVQNLTEISHNWRRYKLLHTRNSIKYNECYSPLCWMRKSAAMDPSCELEDNREHWSEVPCLADCRSFQEWNVQLHCICIIENNNEDYCWYWSNPLAVCRIQFTINSATTK